MIKGVTIKNFLSHKDTELQFSPGVNIIVGATDSGKSAIIRALRWVLTNRPTGDSYRSTWGGDTEVTVEVDDNQIVRAKSKSENLYSLNGDEFKAFGSDVPDEIKKALNLTEVNLQTQFESHFLLARSPGEVASHFNKVAHLDKIDVGLQNVQRWLRKLQQGIQASEEEIELLEEDLQEFNNLPQLEELVLDLEEVENQENNIENKIATLHKLSIKYKDVEEEIEDLSYLTSKARDVDLVLEYLKEGDHLLQRLKTLENTKISIKSIDSKVEYLETLVLYEKEVNKVLQIDNEIEAVGLENFTRLVGRIELLEMKEKNTLKAIQMDEKVLHDNMEVCPLCKTVLK